MKNTYKPGEEAPYSGQYAIINEKGKNTGEERTVVKDKIFPPTPQSGQTYQLVDSTKNKSGKK